jgi:hypothetical protein
MKLYIHGKTSLDVEKYIIGSLPGMTKRVDELIDAAKTLNTNIYEVTITVEQVEPKL